MPNAETIAQREREDLLEAMREAHIAWDAALVASIDAPTDATKAKALDKARTAASKAAGAYHEAKLVGKELAARVHARKQAEAGVAKVKADLAQEA